MTDNRAQELVGRVAKAIELCPVCDGEGHVADGLDEAGCSIPCPPCFGTGYDVSAAIAAIQGDHPTDLLNKAEADVDPVNIWLEPHCCADNPDGRLWCAGDMGDCDDCGDESVQYIRADLVKALHAERDRAREELARLRDIVDKSEDHNITCPICEGREMGPGEFCIATCREGKVLWSTAHVLRSLKFWIDGDREKIVALSEELARVWEQGQQEGKQAVLSWLRERGAMKPRASLWQAAETLADQFEASETPCQALAAWNAGR